MIFFSQPSQTPNMTSALFTDFVMVAPRIGAADDKNIYRVSRLLWVWFMFILVAVLQCTVLKAVERKITSFKRSHLDFQLNTWGFRGTQDESVKNGKEEDTHERWTIRSWDKFRMDKGATHLEDRETMIQ